MRSLLGNGLRVALAVTVWASLGFASFNSVHEDYRKTPKILLELDFRDTAAKSPQDLSRSYLEKNLASFGITDRNSLRFDKVSESLLGQHFHYQQLKNGVEVADGEIIISVNLTENSVFKVFNNYFPDPGSGQLSKKIIGEDAALDLAWNDLRVHGALLVTPTAALQYRVAATGKFTLGYKTMTAVESPAGAWEHFVDADSGIVLSRMDTSLERNKQRLRQDITAYRGATWNRLEALDAIARKELKKAQEVPGDVDTVNGRGLVFDPDPRTSLMNADLNDTSETALFDQAYFERDLLGISRSGTTFQLKGPWVVIADFEAPHTAPSTSVDGKWTAKRGTGAFNDAMTYFHIDQSQRYMQSLGYVNAKGIQFGPIEVDADALDGDDNSHYIPSSNRLAFGHGCVDDNEDSDVILHEYGHAINYSINSHWGSGDMGAMGEGFGDYWAGSYSVSTPNGLNFQSNVVFNWDGAPCWAGRSLNAPGAMYDHATSYGAHTSINGGFQSDELWSTPLFQSLLTLLSRGVPRSEVDKIILEAQFGLGAGIKMREMANTILVTAKTLYPEGIHGSVFQAEFERHKIVEPTE